MAKKITPDFNVALAQLLQQNGVKIKNVDEFTLAGLNQQFAAKDEMLSTLQNYGDGQKASINQDYQTQQNTLMAQLASQGLGGTSMQLSGGLGVERNRQLTLGNLNDQLLGKKLDVLQGFNQGMQGLLGSASQAGLARDQFEYSKTQDEKNSKMAWENQAGSPDQRRLNLMQSAANNASPLPGQFRDMNSVIAGWISGGQFRV